jgi:hypothetical protein
MPTFEEILTKYKTVERGECRDCGNRWWVDMPNCWVCTTCAKTHGKDTSEEWKEPAHDR